MIRRLKNLSRLKGKKRYIVFGFLAVELMSLPAAAQIIHKAAFDVRPLVTAVEIPTSETGLSRFLVTSNAGFDVIANDVNGDISVDVHVSGSLSGGSRFGDAAQLPGLQTACAVASSQNTAIYKANRKIETRKGNAVDRALIMEFKYDPAARPDFKFIAGKNKSAAITPCSN